MIQQNKKSLDPLRHSCAHLLAGAVLNLYPDTKLTIGPAIENGFYYDFDFGLHKITEEDLLRIEKEMQKILPSWTGFSKREVSATETKKVYKNNPYKLGIIADIEKMGEKITFYKAGSFTDLCKGGHCENPSKEIAAFKLLSIAGAYWKGSEKNPMLTRIYGTCFSAKKELENYLNMLEEAKKRDHKKLGPQLELFFFHETAPGMPYWLPKGTTIYNELLKFWREEHAKRGYQEIMSPILNKKELYITSGHFEHYWQDMFVSDMGKDEIYGVKAMNCPNAMNIFAFKTRSYRDLPLKLSDTDSLHRYELSGVLNGLFRVREFRQDDAHIFVTESQIKSEFEKLFEIVEKFYSIFNIEYSFRLGKRPDKFMGDSKVWDQAEKVLETILQESKKTYEIANKEGAFYGPKVDILMRDSLGRSWQMGTLQLDFQQPLRFNLLYSDSDGKMKTPIVIHRVIYGSLERFIGILIEHFAGKFPVWLSPVQIVILPIADRHKEYALNVAKTLEKENIRVDLDNRQETLQAKIRQATLQGIPFMGIMGDKELAASHWSLDKKPKTNDQQLISVRTREGKDLGQIKLSYFLNKLKEKIDKKV